MLTKKEQKAVLESKLKELDVQVFIAETELKHLHQLSITKGEPAYAQIHEKNKNALEILKGKRDYYAGLCESAS